MRDLVEQWNGFLRENPDSEMFEAAFLRAYVEYESIIAEIFMHFSLGRSTGAYQPIRKLSFTDETQLAELIRGEARFIDYSSVISRCSKHIFQIDPFEFVFSLTNYNDEIKKMKLIRNYLAHRSVEAKARYKTSVINEMVYVEPGVYLQKKVKGSSETYYSKYCRVMIEITEFFKNDALLLKI